MSIDYYSALGYFITMNVITLVLFGIDKLKAKRKKKRISESTLMTLICLGGSVGAWCGMYLFRHKTLKEKFSIGVPVILALQVLIVYLVVVVL